MSQCRCASCFFFHLQYSTILGFLLCSSNPNFANVVLGSCFCQVCKTNKKKDTRTEPRVGWKLMQPIGKMVSFKKKTHTVIMGSFIHRVNNKIIVMDNHFKIFHQFFVGSHSFACTIFFERPNTNSFYCFLWNFIL